MELGWAKQQVLTRSTASSSTTCQLSERRESLEKVREENKKTVFFFFVFFFLYFLLASSSSFFLLLPQVPGKTTHPLHQNRPFPNTPHSPSWAHGKRLPQGEIGLSSILFCTFSIFFFLSSPLVFFLLFGSIFTCDDQTWTSGGPYTTRSLTH